MCEFAKDCINDENQRKEWIDKQDVALLEKEPEDVIQAIADLPLTNKEMQVKQENLLNYYKGNMERMRYRKFRSKGLFIGSGAIESAHKAVLQGRLKKSGQHWSLDGLQKMAQIRALYKSNRWEKIKDFAQLPT